MTPAMHKSQAPTAILVSGVNNRIKPAPTAGELAGALWVVFSIKLDLLFGDCPVW
jgi:hypothetical protein